MEKEKTIDKLKNEMLRLYKLQSKYEDMKSTITKMIVLVRSKHKYRYKIEAMEELLETYGNDKSFRASKWASYYDERKNKKLCVHCKERAKQKTDGTFFTLCEHHLNKQRNAIKKQREETIDSSLQKDI